MSNFSIPGLLEISRPILYSQRSKITLPVKRLGDTLWQGIASIGPITPGGVLPAYSLASVKMIFSSEFPVVDDPAFVCSSDPQQGEGFISIANRTTWLFAVPPQPLLLGLGNWAWEIHTKNSAGHTTVYYAGSQQISI